jgi:FixJ family two-component response regulator
MPHVCIIDDDEAVRDSTRELLEAEGVQVSDFTSCEDFLGSSAAPAADCLVLDVNLPGMSGLALLQLLRERGDRRPVMMVTGQPNNQVTARTADLGGVFFKKPFKEAEFIGTLRRLLESPGTRPPT